MAAKKVGLFCSLECISCQGQSCCNIESSATDNDCLDIDEEIADISFFCEKVTDVKQQQDEGTEESTTDAITPMDHQSE